ncbi:hypothetical protein Ahy_Scaffold1g106869 isoform A [Arachis hypogaea]|uniref:Cytochrome P450 n=1 Tax=Arachis hypogaea TaxID=3818 RepID=A0A444WSS6_ARAHY|nr:hypothetical protein Ahy_Scaffold1g106869 isoform A [Arachis hypogaea]
MEDLLQSSSTSIIYILALLICIFIYYLGRSVTKSESKTCTAPQAGGALPIIGHLPLFGGKKLLFETLCTMAEKYGPAFTIKMGSNRVLVLSSWEMAKECFTEHDKSFSDRPLVTASRLLGYDGAMFGFAPYGPYWREMRKIVTIHLLSNHRIDLLKHIRASEVEMAMRELYGLWSSKGCPENGILVEMKQWFGDLAFNIILRMVSCKRYFGVSSEDGKAQYFQNIIRDFINLFGVPVISDSIPALWWWDIHGYKKKMKETAQKLDQLIGEWLEEHKQRRLLGKDGEEELDFMDVMLRVLQENPINLLAGSDSIMVAITWILSLMLNNPQVLKKAQDELDNKIGRNRQVEESDIKDLVYLQAIVKESLRLSSPSAVIFPRAAMKDCTLSTGYHIPAGTKLMINIWKIMHDENLWPDPYSFQPERFLCSSHKDIDVRGQHYELLPFGSGRRSCPGISLSLNVMHLILAALLHSFEITTPSNEPVDMTKSIGLTNVKATPLEARGAWPIIGHLHLFGSHQLTHRTLGAMAEEHGPIFTIKLGSYKVLVLSSCEMVKECFTIHDKAFSTRPCVAASKLMGYDCAMFGFTPYGPYWREIRKLTTLQLLSNHRLELLKKTRETELDSAIRKLYKIEGGVFVDMKEWFGDLTHNVSLRMVGGRPYYGESGDGYEESEEARKYKKAMRECVRLFGVFVLSDAIPSLGWLDFNGHEKAMKKTASEMDTLVKGWLDEHKRKRASNKEEQDFMDVMLNTLQNAHIFGYSADTIIKATCLVSK